MKKTMTFLVLAVFASAILVGCAQEEGDPTVSTPAVTDTSAGTMESKPGAATQAGEPTVPTTGTTPAAGDSAPATSDSAAPSTTTPGGN